MQPGLGRTVFGPSFLVVSLGTDVFDFHQITLIGTASRGTLHKFEQSDTISRHFDQANILWTKSFPGFGSRDILETGFVELDGGKLYYETDGKGPALVLIHAGFLDSRMWDSQFPSYSKSYKTIRYDVRGFGRSSIAKEKFSDHTDLRALLTHLNVARAAIIGVSNGGRIALDFAVEYPERVQSLILVSPGVSGYKVSGPEEERLWNEFEEQMNPQEVADREGRAADAVEMDVNAWAAAQDPPSR